MASPPPVTGGGGTGRRPPVTADAAMMHGMTAGHHAAAAGETTPTATTPIIPPLSPPPAAQTGTLLPTTTTTTTTTTSSSPPHPAPSYISVPPPREARSLLPAAASQLHPHHDDASIPSSPPKMIFSDLYRSTRSPLAKLRHAHPLPADLALQPDFDADLVSRDKTKQKEAVKRYLAEKVRTDWDFAWPSVVEPAPSPGPEPEPEPASAPEGTTPDKDMEGFLEVAVEDRLQEAPSTASDDDDDDDDDEGAILDSGDEADSETESVYSAVSEDPVHFRPRAEWVSDLSDDEDMPASASPFRFDSPESVAVAVKTSSMARKARRRRQLRKEMAWNRGLQCFEARRNAWTGARTVRVRPKPATPSSPSAPRRGLFWRARTHSTAKSLPHPLSPATTHSPTGAASLSPVTTSTSQHSAPSTAPTTGPDSATPSLCPETAGASARRPESYPVETLLPVAPPLLPPQNPMRASISPALYVSIYDKVVVHGLQPSCPINLSDTVRACVSGWKRDGEWPPRPAEPQAVVAVRRRQQKRQRDAKAAPPAAAAAARRMSFGFLAARGGEAHADGDDGSAGGAIKRGLYKVLSLGHGQPASPASGDVAR